MKTYQQPDDKETERFWSKIWQPQKKHNERAEWVKNIRRELERLEEGPKAEIHIDLLKTTQKRIPNWKKPGHDGIYGFWLKKFTSIHESLALEMNRCLQGAQVPELDGKRPKRPKQRNPSKQLLTDNLPTGNVKNTNSKNKKKMYYSLKNVLLTNKPWIVP